MDPNSNKSLIDQTQKIILLLSALFLATLLFFYKGGINSEAPLDQLARQSLDPETALKNGHPTIIEYYADWCEACREMAPSMLSIENQFNDQLDIVLLNVENKRWQELITKYEVKGIPQLDLFDSNGDFSGTTIGLRNYDQLESLITSLLNNDKLPSFIVSGKVSNL